MQVRSRVVEVIDIPGSRVRPNPKNWRTHPTAQKDALRGLLAEVGLVDVLKVVKHPEEPGAYMLIDGHARAELLGEQSVKVAVLDLTPSEQSLVLASFDPVGNLAGTDQEMLDLLLQGLDVENEALRKMLTDMASVDPGETPDLDDVAEDLGDEDGDMDESVFWPEIKLRVPPDILSRWSEALKDTGEKLPHMQVSALLDRVVAPDGDSEF